MKKRIVLITVMVLVTFGISTLVMADGTETLGPPSIPIASGSGIVAAGTGLESQPGSINLNVPSGVTINQVLLYWSNETSGIGDDTINVNGTPILGTSIGGPTTFYTNMDVESFRADITNLGFVSPGANTLDVDGLDPIGLGAGVLVIFDDGSSEAEIQVRDGNDLAFFRFAPPLDTTVAQTFNFAPASIDRTADLSMFFGSVRPDGFRPNSIEVTVSGITTVYSDLLDSHDGRQWDTLTLAIDIPAGADSLTVQAFSRDDNDTGALPASLNWIGAGLSVPQPPPPPEPSIFVRKQAKGEDSRTFPSGSDVTFEIYVENDGEVNLTNVTVDDPLLPACEKNIGDLAIGESITYECTDFGVIQGYTNEVIATGNYNEVDKVEDKDPSTVEIIEPNPSIFIRKQAKGEDSRTFPSGSDVTFEIYVENNGNVNLTNVTVDDPLLPTCKKDIGDLAIGESITYECTDSGVIQGYTNEVIATGNYNEVDKVEDKDPSTVKIASIFVRKQAKGEDSRTFPSGSDVTFEIYVENDGEVNLTDVTVDDPLLPACEKNIGDLAVGESITYECTDIGVIQGYTNEVIATGNYNEVDKVEDKDPSTVEVAEESEYKVYLPLVGTPRLSTFDIALGYEDLKLNDPDEMNDFDYNDWVISIRTDVDFTEQIDDLTVILSGLSFQMIPQARGATLDHEFRFNFPANTFGSDGTATLIIRDGDGNIIGNFQTPFIASQANDFLIIDHTYNAFPPQGMTKNTIEGTGPDSTQRTAQLTIEFDTPALFTFTEEVGPHGENLFFDPYIRVNRTNEPSYDVGKGDVRTLVFPLFSWDWPEERIRIDNAYTNLQFVGPPEMFIFPDDWWLVHNTCVYGDGIPCSISNPLAWQEEFLNR